MTRWIFALLILCLLPVGAHAADTTAPKIVLQAPSGTTLVPDAYGMVRFAVRAEDAGKVRSLTLTIPHGYASAYPRPPTAWVQVRAGWDTREDAPGEYSVMATAWDVAGNRAVKTWTFSLTKPPATKAVVTPPPLVDPTAPSVSGTAYIAGLVNFQLFENVDTTGDGLADNRLAYNYRGQISVNAVLDHKLAVYDREKRTARFIGNGVSFTNRVRVEADVIPWKTATYNGYRVTFIGYKIDGNLQLVYVNGQRVVVIRQTTLYPKNLRLIFP